MYFTEKKDFQEFDKAKNRPRIVFLCVHQKMLESRYDVHCTEKEVFM